MEVLYARCCGLDIHKKEVTACVVILGKRETRTFSTMTNDLLRLKAWLLELDVTHVAMESTGVFWKPLYNLLEDKLTMILTNAQQIKALPGRKTDVKDAEWLADLLRHGLVKGSFIPAREQREQRELTRYRRSLIEERTRVVERLQQVLEGANIKLSSVATDITGVSGRSMLEAMISGISDPNKLADMAQGRMRKKKAALEEALNGLIGEHQKMMLTSQLRHVDFLDSEITRMDEEIGGRLEADVELMERLDEIPGVNRRIAEEFMSEVGKATERFATPNHLASWIGLCPGNNESAGKRKGGRTRHGNRWLCSALVQAARGASRSNGNYLSAQYHRLAARRGDKRAIVAVAHSICVIIYNMVHKGTKYNDLGHLYFDEHDAERVLRRTVHRIETLGYKVSLELA
ncbi:MAG: IS110 family transposase [Dehalococcoidales bacterium]|nr:IS110 family transposase [Dehalococcoidales bacterium]